MSYHRMREAAKHILFTYVMQVICILGAAFSIYLARLAMQLNDNVLAIVGILLLFASGSMFMKEADARAFWAKVYYHEKGKGPWRR